jgi:hypothetical protein
VLGFGVMGLITFAGHVFNPVQTAERIGWSPHPQFQRELGLFELGYALAAFLALVIRNRYYWLGALISPGFFLLTAGLNHVLQSLQGDLAAYNVWTSLPDILIPLTAAYFLMRVFRLEPHPGTASPRSDSLNAQLRGAP